MHIRYAYIRSIDTDITVKQLWPNSITWSRFELNYSFEMYHVQLRQMIKHVRPSVTLEQQRQINKFANNVNFCNNKVIAHNYLTVCCLFHVMFTIQRYMQNRLWYQTPINSSICVVVKSMGAYEGLSGHPARPVLGWVARLNTRFLNTTPASLLDLDSENRCHGSPSSFG